MNIFRAWVCWDFGMIAILKIRWIARIALFQMIICLMETHLTIKLHRIARSTTLIWIEERSQDSKSHYVP